jgi:deoxyribonuclease IV
MILGIHSTKSSHVLDDKSDADDLSTAIKRDVDALNLNAVQIFTYGPQNLLPNKINYDKVVENTKDIDLTVHSSYLSVGIWKVLDDTSEGKIKQRVSSIEAQLLSCKKIGAWGLVLHVTKVLPEIVANIMKKYLLPISKKTKVKLVLEMVSSKASNDTYETPEKINRLTDLIGEGNWGWCVDTAHLWGAGVDIKEYKQMYNWLDSIKDKKKILMFHLNGSSVERGSGKDVHEIPFSPHDKIWYKVYNPGAKAVVEFAIKHSSTMIMEINRGKEEHVRDTIKRILQYDK